MPKSCIDDQKPIIELPDNLICLAHKELDPIFERDDFITKHELRAMLLFLLRFKRVKASYKTRVTYIKRDNIPRSQASIESTAWAVKQGDVLSRQIEDLVEKFIRRHPLAPFVEHTPGFGYIDLAYMIAAFDIKQAETCGRFWSWAGLDPNKRYTKKRTKLAFEMRTVIYVISESLLKRNHFYRSIYYHRRAVETIKNLNGEYARLARKIDRKRGQERRVDVEPNGNYYKWTSGILDPEKVKPYLYGTLAPVPNKAMYVDEGCTGVEMLPPVALHARARRYMVKAMLAHLHYCWYHIDRGHPPPKPYVLDLRNQQRIEIPPQFKHLC